MEAAPWDKPESREPVLFARIVANESQSGYDAKDLLRRDKEKSTGGWAIEVRDGEFYSREAIFIPRQPVGFPGGTILTIRLRHELKHAARNLGRFRLSVTTAGDPAFLAQLPARLRPALAAVATARTVEQSKGLSEAYRKVSPLLEPERKRVAELKNSLAKLGIATAMIMRESGSGRPSAYLRERGSFLSKGEKVMADVPSALNPLPPGSKANRLALAEWLVSEDNPLTARVTVNRFWETLFGTGLVETSEDFGTQGRRPHTRNSSTGWLCSL